MHVVRISVEVWNTAQKISLGNFIVLIHLWGYMRRIFLSLNHRNLLIQLSCWLYDLRWSQTLNLPRHLVTSQCGLHHLQTGGNWAYVFMRFGCSHVVWFLIRLMVCSTELSLCFSCMSSTSAVSAATLHIALTPLWKLTVAEKHSLFNIISIFTARGHYKEITEPSCHVYIKRHMFRWY